MDAELYEMAKQKCDVNFGIGLSSLIKIFLKSFVIERPLPFGKYGEEGSAVRGEKIGNVN